MHDTTQNLYFLKKTTKDSCAQQASSRYRE